jgi:hypothetical protein
MFYCPRDVVLVERLTASRLRPGADGLFFRGDDSLASRISSSTRVFGTASNARICSLKCANSGVESNEAGFMLAPFYPAPAFFGRAVALLLWPLDGANIDGMKTKSEIAERLSEVRARLESIVSDRKAKPRGGGGSGIKSLRVLEGQRAALAWVLDEPDPGPTPTIW